MAAKADGTTMLVDNIASSAMLDTVVKNLPFKVSDRTFVAVTAYTPMMFIVHPDSPFKTLQRTPPMRMKKDTETFTWTSLGGVGAQDMVFRQFAVAAGVDVSKTRAVALKGGAEAVTMTAGGHVRLGTGTWSAIAAPLSAGKLRVLAVAGPERWPRPAGCAHDQGGRHPRCRGRVLDRHLRAARPARRHRRHLGRGAQGGAGRQGRAGEDAQRRRRRLVPWTAAP